MYVCVYVCMQVGRYAFMLFVCVYLAVFVLYVCLTSIIELLFEGPPTKSFSLNLYMEDMWPDYIVRYTILLYKTICYIF